MMEDQRQQRGELASIEATEAARVANRAWIAGTIETIRRLATDPELLR